MAFLFGRPRQKSPQELARAVRDLMGQMDRPLEKRRAAEEIARLLSQMKVIVQGSPEVEASPEQVHALATEALSTDLLPLLCSNLHRLDFEVRKDVTAIYTALLRYGQDRRLPTVEYISQRRPDTLLILLRGYEMPEISNNCGTMLRDSIKYEVLANLVLNDPGFWRFFDYVQGGSFDVSSDAFSTFKDLLTRHKTLVAQFLQRNYDQFFARYNNLLKSNNYVAKRQSIKLLGEILLDRANYTIMTMYVDSAEHLKLTMNLLRDKSRNVQYEAFHVFKVFVANPKKSKAVQDILVKNREKLLDFLPKFHAERRDDEQFIDEKAFLTKQIESLQPLPKMVPV
ncbi:Mo25-like protein [Kalaharituber pfeilii]|nr:Mo25-like protein [Kalaharituber pfeilii]